MTVARLSSQTPLIPTRGTDQSRPSEAEEGGLSERGKPQVPPVRNLLDDLLFGCFVPTIFLGLGVVLSRRVPRATSVRIVIRDTASARELRTQIGQKLAQIRERGQVSTDDGDVVRRLVREHSRAVGLPMIVADSSYPRNRPQWQDAILKIVSERLRGSDHFSEELILPLEKTIPVHSLRGRMASAGFGLINIQISSFKENLNDWRGMVLYRLMDEGWRQGTVPSSQMIHGITVALGWFPQSLVVAGPTPEGLYLLLNGHHRLAALVTLVNERILPRSVLDQIPFVRSCEVNAMELLRTSLRSQKKGSIPPHSWVRLMRFHSRQVEGAKKLGLTADLADLTISPRRYKVVKGGEVIESDIPGRYAGWRRGKIFGRLDCQSGMRMRKEHRVFFLTWEDAIREGYRPCKNCKPTPS